MIFPRECKRVGYARGRPCGERVYFLTEYLVREVKEGHEVLRIRTRPNESGLMRSIAGVELLASPEEVCWYPERVNLFDRYRLVLLAGESGRRCTIFQGRDEHVTFVLDPDPGEFLTIHVYDIAPPAPTLSSCIRELEACGIFSEVEARFVHHVRDISEINADVYPCRASGFERTLDADPMRGGERIAGCRTGAELYRECHGERFDLVNICPLEMVDSEPFIARCCRSEREGVGYHSGRLGAVVHWAASPMRIARAIEELCSRWKER